MKSLDTSFRLMSFVALVLLVLACAPQDSLAQTVSVSPASLSFGIPAATPPPVTAPTSAPGVVTVNVVPGSGSVTISSVAVSPSSPFTVTGTSCLTPSSQPITFTSPTTCEVSVTLTTSSTALVTDTLVISNTAGALSVPLSGAYGAIKLFDETSVASTTSLVTGTNPYGLYTIATTELNLSCGATPTAKLSNTPDGLGNVLVDSYILLSINGTAVNGTTVGSNNSPAGNVCSGGPEPYVGGQNYSNCSTAAYQDFVEENFAALNGLDPDTFTNSNAVLPPVAHNSDGGVPALDIHTFFPNTIGATPPFLQAAFTLQELGSDAYDNSTLFLVTNCTSPGVVSGANVTLDPIIKTNSASQTQTATLDSSPSQNISFTTSTSVAIEQNSGIVNSGIVPIVTNFAIPQQLFSQLVAGTSTASAVCVRLTGEADLSVTPPAPMCAGYLLQCRYTDPDTGITTTTGDNCTNAETAASFRYLIYAAQFTSPDEPSGYNFLTTQPWAASTPYTLGQTIVDPGGYVQQVTTAGTSSSSIPNFSPDTVGGTTSDGASLVWTNEGVNACLDSGPGGVNAGGGAIACAPGTGPGMLMGSDYWLCGSPGCTPPPVTTTTPTSPATYSNVNCLFTSTGNLYGAPCPLNVLTSFQGASDGKHGAAPPTGNSLYIPVVNMPLPSATAAIPTSNNGWINSLSAATAAFTSVAANYPPSAANPPANGFNPAAPYSLTYGVSAWPLPDTTYPVPGDTAIYNSNTTPTAPFCNGAPLTFAPMAPYSTLATLPGYFNNLPNGLVLSEGGIYYLHYFTTDCAFTEGLLFNPQGGQLTNASANWASFPNLPFGVDTVAPTLSCSTTPSPAYTGGSGSWYNSNVTVSCNGTDNESGFAPGTPVPNTNNTVLQGSSTTSISQTTACGPGSTCVDAIGPLQVTDLAGNSSTPSGPYSFQIDRTPPTITGLTLSAGPYYVNYGPAISVQFSCSDGVGSGIASCSGSTTNAPGFVLTGCTAPGETVTCTGTIPNTAPVNGGNFTVTATDNVGLSATPASVGFSVLPAPQTITFGPLSNQFYINPPITLSATASSGLTVSFSSGTPTVCAVSGTTVSYINAGLCMITASQGGDADFSAAPPVSQSFQVIIGPWTVTATSSSPCPFFGTLSLKQSSSCSFVVQNPSPTLTTIKVAIPGAGGGEGGGQSGEIDPDDFAITTNGCPSSLAGGKTCNVTVTFTPDGDDLALYAAGGSLAYLQVTGKAKAVLAYSTLTGKAEDPTVSLSPTTSSSSPYSFGSTSGTTTFTLTNNGPTTLILGNTNSIKVTGKYFELGAGTDGGVPNCTNGLSVPAGSSCAFYVTFTKPASGSQTVIGSVTITDNAVTIANPNKVSTQIVYLSGK